MSKKTSLVTKNKHVRRRRIILTSIALIGMLVGLYLLLLIFSPQIEKSSGVFNQGIYQEKEAPTVAEYQLYIPKINLSVAYASGGSEVLDDKAWHRFPERGDPEKGGNFILSGHRFEMGFTPRETVHKSPFYHLDKLDVGDSIYIDFKKVRYKYKVTEKFSVTPTQTEIEAPSETAKLTLYTCSLGGEDVGREVFIAEPVEDHLDPATPLTLNQNVAIEY